MIEIHHYEDGDIHSIAVNGEKLHSDDGESWFLPKSLGSKLRVADLPNNVRFCICQNAEDGFIEPSCSPFKSG